MPSFAQLSKPLAPWLKVAAIVICLYLFIAGVSGMGEAFNLFGKGFANRVLAATCNPFAALMMGLLATSLVQSSSTTTSIIVGMVAGGALSIEAAIPMVMGANIGTTITATMVSFGSMRHPAEFERAFGTALLHLFFNVAAVSIIFPLEISTGILTEIAHEGQLLFSNVGGMWLCNPMKAATGPFISLLKILCFGNPVLLLFATLGITYVMLVWMVKLLRSLVLSKVEVFFDKVLFRSWPRAMLFGFLLTVAMQTSSVPTSLAVPLAGAGVLKLMQVYPFTLGSNVGTTITAFLAALATGMELPVIVAFSHISFNVIGILIIWTFPAVRKLPLLAAQYVAKHSMKARYIPVTILVSVYFIIPFTLVLIFA